MKKNNKFKNKSFPQEINIIGSNFIKGLKILSLLLHIIAFVLGIITLLEITIEGFGKNKDILEIVTLIVVALVILQHMFEPLLNKLLLKTALYYFWGNKNVETIIFKPENIDMEVGGFGKVTKSIEFKQKELINIDLIKTGLLESKKLIIKMSAPANKTLSNIFNKDGNIDAFLIPRYILIDVKLNQIRLGGKLEFDLFEDEVTRELEFTFDVHNEKATWSGVFPEYPFYGSWKWVNDGTQHKSLFTIIFGKK